MMRIILVLVVALCTTGCVSAVASIVTLPIKVAGKVVDAATTSQSEADRNRGRDLRKAEEREDKAQRKREKEEAKRARDDD